MGFKSTILVVEDIARSRMLYEDILKCKVEADFGLYNVGFEGGLALYRKSFFTELIHQIDNASKTHNVVIYFEFKDIYSLRDRIVADGFELLHDIKEQPWGQSVLRFYDYDQHIVEVGEDMETTLVNMYRSGMSAAAIAVKTGYPEDHIKTLLGV
ncbi:glyoxalase [Paenibacillus sp. FSL R7-269]|uniref:VOC family protein n=1 Tax=Paenibacillus sp. FSL R7-269 TaxID=1226755 RepID=UPI0003E29F1A|nr:VOC family protein [Paenibacillus sp. FSL R7-269]ETT30112.1 glyoxalase [Paenibacillus sp. FSL R7-269]